MQEFVIHGYSAVRISLKKVLYWHTPAWFNDDIGVKVLYKCFVLKRKKAKDRETRSGSGQSMRRGRGRLRSLGG